MIRTTEQFLNKECANEYNIQQLFILGKTRSKFRLTALEATYNKSLKQICYQKFASINKHISFRVRAHSFNARRFHCHRVYYYETNTISSFSHFSLAQTMTSAGAGWTKTFESTPLLRLLLYRKNFRFDFFQAVLKFCTTRNFFFTTS